MTFNYWVKYRRRKLGLSRTALAIQAGLFLGTITRIERYDSSPQGKTLRKIEGVLGPYESRGTVEQESRGKKKGNTRIDNDLALAKAQGILNRVIRRSEETKKEAEEALKEIAKLIP